jgi:hypothetical protein
MGHENAVGGSWPLTDAEVCLVALQAPPGSLRGTATEVGRCYCEARLLNWGVITVSTATEVGRYYCEARSLKWGVVTASTATEVGRYYCEHGY